MSKIKPETVQDSRIADITSVQAYAVQRGAGQNTYQSFPSASSSNSSISFNVNPPSESVVIDRNAMVETEIRFEIRISEVPIGEKAFQYASTDALQAFPFNSLISNASLSLNNTTISQDVQSTKDMILKQISQKDLSRYQDTCPALVDATHKYYDTATANSVLGGYGVTSINPDYTPRGCHPVLAYSVSRFVDGAFVNNSTLSTGLNNSWIINLTVKTTEPVMVSPFVFGRSPEGSEQGLYGINQMNLVFNIDSQMKRFWSTMNAWKYEFVLDNTLPFKSNLLLNFLTPQADDCVPTRNMVPYLEFPRYITPSVNTSSFVPGATQNIICSNIQLAKIPDLLLIAARKPISLQGPTDSASFLPIVQTSINFNNQSGLLASASHQDLYKMSTRNGCKQNWLEYSGDASTVNISAEDGRPTPTSTIGGVMVINPAYDLSLFTGYANGSVGQFGLQVSVTVFNNSRETLQPEVVIIAVSSGILTTVAGNSQIQTGLLDKQTVMTAASEKHSSSLRRMVGGSLASKIGAVLRNVQPIARVLKEVSGSGVSSAGGVRSAGGEKSAGMMNKLQKFC